MGLYYIHIFAEFVFVLVDNYQLKKITISLLFWKIQIEIQIWIFVISVAQK